MQLPEWTAASACPAPEDVCVLVGIPDVLLAACSFGGQGVVCLAAWLFGGRTGARILGKPTITPIQAELSAHSSGPHLQASVYAGCVRTWRIPGSSYNPHLHRQGALWHCLAKLLLLSWERLRRSRSSLVGISGLLGWALVSISLSMHASTRVWRFELCGVHGVPALQVHNIIFDVQT